MADRPLYYTSAPKIHAAMERLGAEHDDQLAGWIRDLEGLGAERNDVLSLLAHCAALGAARALAIMGARAADLGLAATSEPQFAQEAQRMFMADVMMRTLALGALRPAPETEP